MSRKNLNFNFVWYIGGSRSRISRWLKHWTACCSRWQTTPHSGEYKDTAILMCVACGWQQKRASNIVVETLDGLLQQVADGALLW